MKSIAALVCLGFLAMASGQGLNMQQCDDSVCNCPKPNVFPGVVAVKTDKSGSACFCACGLAEKELCDVSGHCTLGTECAAPEDLTKQVDKTKGVCQGKCKRHRCPQFQVCALDEKFEVVCKCRTFPCSSTLELMVEGTRVIENQLKKQVFKNSCEMVNENCKISNSSPLMPTWQPTWSFDQNNSA